LEKQVMQRSREAADEKTEYNLPIKGRTERSTRSAYGQKNPILTAGQQVRDISRLQIRGSADGHREGGFQGNTQDGK
jgi:hypothetical protein